MTGCDTFVVLPDKSANGGVIFGKNSDRPQGEVQEVVYIPGSEHGSGDKVQCTYIEIDQVAKTKGVILSKPAWMWGAEMGANESGVVIGNEAVYTKAGLDEEEKLLGMDLVRLGLERSSTASEALDVITSLLEAHGQGGPCSDLQDMNYHNSFLIADSSEAWVLETAGPHWAAELVKSGFRNISNCLSITTNIDKMSANLKSYATDNNLWNGEGDFNFKEAYSTQDCARLESGRNLLAKYSESGSFKVENMFSVLRDKESGICRDRDDPFHTASSQVSVLYNGKPSIHWFTGTPDPSVSIFKPFVFTANSKISQHTVSPTFEDDPAKTIPRFKTTVDRRHNLFKLHEKALKEKPGVLDQLKEMEFNCRQEVEAFVETENFNLAELDELFKDVVETEIKFYK